MLLAGADVRLVHCLLDSLKKPNAVHPSSDGCRTHDLGETPLHVAIRCGRSRNALALAESRWVDKTVRNGSGKSALHLCVEKDYTDVAAALFRTGGADLPLAELQSIVQIIQGREIKPEDYDLFLALDAAVAQQNRSSSVSHAPLPLTAIGSEHRILGSVCVICLEALCTGDLAAELSCTHAFHGACIEQWCAAGRYNGRFQVSCI